MIFVLEGGLELSVQVHGTHPWYRNKPFRKETAIEFSWALASGPRQYSTYNFRPDVKNNVDEWCKKNCRYPYSIRNDKLYVTHDDDLVLLKIAFS